MKSKIALITGANKGIGFETARQLGKLGFTVLIGARDPEKGKIAAHNLRKEEITAQAINLEVTNPESIAFAAAEVESEYGVLDVLINNAGVLLSEDLRSPIEVSAKTFKKTYDVNVFAVHEVTKSFWPLLNRSTGARLVNVSSALGSLTLHSNGSFPDFKAIAYDSSKAALNMMTTHYAHLWKGTPHKANAVHPGSVKTDMNAQGTVSVQDGAKTGVRLATIGEDGPNGEFFFLNDPLPW